MTQKTKSDPYLPHDLRLRAGETVEVRSEQEILQSLDRSGTLDGLPFMPEMLQYCGRRFRVDKRAHKTCDTIAGSGGRRMTSAVHLEEVRCDGEHHGGCQASCLIFWKEAWLKRVSSSRHVEKESADASPVPVEGESRRAVLDGATRESDDPDEPTYRCQATELLNATSPLAWWNPRQYVEDMASGNVGAAEVLWVFLLRVLHRLMRIGVGYRVLSWAYDRIARLQGGAGYPYRTGDPRRKTTPREKLDLQPGEMVQVKSHDEILDTVDGRGLNRGMRFDAEMVRYCGGTYRVKSRVDRIINEQTGKMMRFRNACIMFDGVVCRSECSDRRLFCPRSIPSYWREIWLRRVG